MPWAEKQILPQQEGFYEREMVSYKLFLTFDSGYSKTVSLADYMYTNRFFKIRILFISLVKGSLSINVIRKITTGIQTKISMCIVTFFIHIISVMSL